MKWIFSDCVSLPELGVQPDPHSLYLGFAAEPAPGVFSQKFPGSTLGSVTESVWRSRNQMPQDLKSVKSIVIHTVRGRATLDGALALFLIYEHINFADHPFFERLVSAASRAESGVIPAQFEVSLMAWFITTAKILELNPHEFSNQEQINHELITQCHALLRIALQTEIKGTFVDFDSVMELPELRSFCATQQQFIQVDVQNFWEHDVAHSLCLQIDLPMRKDAAYSHKKLRMNSLVTVDPKASLYRFFARSGQLNPFTGRYHRYPLTYVHSSELRGAVHEHVISIDPAMNCHLRSISGLLESLEEHLRPTQRPTDQPRPGYRYNDPWYDERHGNASIIDTPSEGSILQHGSVLSAVYFKTTPARSLSCGSFQISVQTELDISMGRMLERFVENEYVTKSVLNQDSEVHFYLHKIVVNEIHKLLQIQEWFWDQSCNTIQLKEGKTTSIFWVFWLIHWLQSQSYESATKFHLYLSMVYDETLEQKADSKLVRQLYEQLGNICWPNSLFESAELSKGLGWYEITME